MKPVLVLLSLFLSSAAIAHKGVLPEDHNPYSQTWIDYSDLNHVLASSVLDMGPSTHERAGPVKKDTTSRLYSGSQTASRHEGNRVAFHLFRDDHKAALRAIRDDLLALPEAFNLEELSRNHQLAYWLNLHNAIVLAEMAERYPFNRLKPLFDRETPSAFINSETFDWNGAQITLADIQDHVLANWQDPLVIYGFYLGAVGTPNIRAEAFSGEQIYDQLRENARDFVNSVRGTQIWDGNALRVSSYYQRMAVKFPDFEQDLLRHIREYARPDFKRRLVSMTRVEARIDDWNIADLYNGQLHAAGQTYSRVAVNHDGTLLPQRNVPIHVRRVLEGRDNNFKRAKPSVEIEALASETSKDVEDQSKAKEKSDDDN